MVEADDSAAAAEAVHAAGLPARLLADLATVPQRDLVRPGPAAAAALVVAEAQLGLLQALALAGLRSGGEHAAHRVAAATFAERLAACAALDLTPEEPAGAGGAGAAGSLRVRLGRLAAAALRVVTVALAGLAGSPQVRGIPGGLGSGGAWKLQLGFQSHAS